MSDDKTWQWLESTRELQEQVYGFDLAGMQANNPDEFADYVVMNHTAAVSELSEALDEVGWKSWAKPRGWVNRDAFVKELIDVAHFVANLAVSVGCTDEEWQERYESKQRVNRQRQLVGYDGVSTKCPDCHRALDDDTDSHQCSGR